MATFAVAGLLAVGGAGAFATRRSVPSLVVGVGSGALLALAGLELTTLPLPKGYGHAAAISLMVTGAMGARAARTKAAMPTALALLGAASAAAHTYRFNEYRIAGIAMKNARLADEHALMDAAGPTTTAPAADDRTA